MRDLHSLTASLREGRDLSAEEAGGAADALAAAVCHAIRGGMRASLLQAAGRG